MTADQISWAGTLLALILFVVVFVRSGRADRANKRFLNRVRGRKSK